MITSCPICSYRGWATCHLCGVAVCALPWGGDDILNSSEKFGASSKAQMHSELLATDTVRICPIVYLKSSLAQWLFDSTAPFDAFPGRSLRPQAIRLVGNGGTIGRRRKKHYTCFWGVRMPRFVPKKIESVGENWGGASPMNCWSHFLFTAKYPWKRAAPGALRNR